MFELKTAKTVKLLFGLLLAGLSSCTTKDLNRADWEKIQSECRQHARITTAKAFGSGAIHSEDEVYNVCVKTALGNPSTLGELGEKIIENASDEPK